MTVVLTVKRGDKVTAGNAIFTPQHATGPLLVTGVHAVEVFDEGRKIEFTTDCGRKHVVAASDRVLVIE